MLLSLSVLLITLQSFYFYGLGFAPLAAVGWLGLLAVALRPAWRSGVVLHDLREAARSRLWMATLVAIGCSGAIGYLNSVEAWSPKAWLSFILIFGLLPFARHIDPVQLRKSVWVAVGVHLSAYYVQWASFLAQGRLDYLHPFTGESQRFYSNHANGVLRPTGLFNEPSTYCLFMTVMILLLFRLEQKKGINTSRLTIGLSFLALFSLLRSLSVLGWASAVVLLFSLVIHRGISTRIKIALFAGAFAIFGLVAVSDPEMTTAVQSNVDRVMHLPSDTSFRERISGQAYGGVPKESAAERTLVRLPQSWLGEGLGNYTQTKSIGMGLLYYPIYLGVFAVPLLIFLFTTFRKLTDRLVLLLFLVHAPYVQHPIFSFSLMALHPTIGSRTGRTHFFHQEKQ